MLRDFRVTCEMSVRDDHAERLEEFARPFLLAENDYQSRSWRRETGILIQTLARGESLCRLRLSLSSLCCLVV